MNCMNCGAGVKNSSICPKCGCDLSVQKKALQLYRALGQYFPQRPELSTINVCSKLLQDLTHEEGAYELLEAYMQLLA